MKVENFITVNQKPFSETKQEELRREKAAIDFEQIFAKHLVNELTKHSFKMTESGTFGQSNSLYREFVTDALASELAAQRRLGMADLVEKYWEKISEK